MGSCSRGAEQEPRGGTALSLNPLLRILSLAGVPRRRAAFTQPALVFVGHEFRLRHSEYQLALR
jgi:hypothetical protein